MVEAKALDLKWLEYLSKPLLMPVLALSLYATFSPPTGAVDRSIVPVLVSLLFAFLGDVCLMFKRSFLLGLAAFFLMQCVYLYLLWPEEVSLLLAPASVVPAALLVASFFLQYSLVQRNLGSKKIPAILYFASFSAVMLLASIVYVSSPTPVNGTLLLGVFLFYISDSLIALSLFRRDFPFSGGAIMLTYGFGQYLFLESYVRSMVLQ